MEDFFDDVSWLLIGAAAIIVAFLILVCPLTYQLGKLEGEREAFCQAKQLEYLGQDDDKSFYCGNENGTIEIEEYRKGKDGVIKRVKR